MLRWRSKVTAVLRGRNVLSVVSSMTFVAVFGASCGSPEANTSPPVSPASVTGYGDLGFARFETAVSAKIDRKFRIYWLGRSFTARGITFRGPSFAEIGGINEAGWLSLHYVPEKAGPGLGLESFDSLTWRDKRSRLLGPQPGAPMSVPIGSREAELYRVGLDGRLGVLYVVIEMDEGTVVVAHTAPEATALTATPNPNPLVDESILLDVLAGLRPYEP